LKRAQAIHPISAVQTEYSLWSRDPEREILQYCKESGVAFVAYSPLGRGFLTGQITKPDDLAEDDWRRNAPRFQADNFEKNLSIVSTIKTIASNKGCTPAQLALAWVIAQGEHIFPIPGTKKVKYLEENAGAADIRFNEKELSDISSLFHADIAAGQRYTEGGMKIVNA
jgi:aryl-alcohol dehydrogenase-like predicted oxidoreductase